MFWEGPLATIVPTANAHVWGVIWRLHKDDLECLDSHEDIDTKKFFVKYVQVLTPHMDILTCRTYMQRVYPLPKGNRDPIPVEQWPSWSYKEIMIMGAKQNGLPPCYIRFLRKLKDNGNEGYIRTDYLLMRYGYDEPCVCTVSPRILREPLKINLKKIRANKRLLKIV